MADFPHGTAHPHCREAGEHVCQKPSGRLCIEGCGQPAGTWWGPMWCPDCDLIRIDRVSEQLRKLAGVDRG